MAYVAALTKGYNWCWKVLLSTDELVLSDGKSGRREEVREVLAGEQQLRQILDVMPLSTRFREGFFLLDDHLVGLRVYT